jgi:hypothetical protein
MARLSQFGSTATTARRWSRCGSSPVLALASRTKTRARCFVLADSASAPMFANAGCGEATVSEEARS